MLTHWPLGDTFETVISEHMLQIKFLCTCEIEYQGIPGSHESFVLSSSKPIPEVIIQAVKNEPTKVVNVITFPQM